MERKAWVSGEIVLSADGRPVKLHISVPVMPVKPQTMLRVFQKMANAFTDLAVKDLQASGKSVSCKAGCGACCRQPVPITEVEVYHLAAVVAAMPEPRRTEIRNRFERAASHFEEKGWFARLEQSEDKDALQHAILEYFFERIPCPFLEDESCSIYEARPIVCREFLVSSAAENCSHPLPENIDQLHLPLKASGGMSQIARGQSLPRSNFIPLILALRLAEKHPERFSRKTGEQWLGEFFG